MSWRGPLKGRAIKFSFFPGENTQREREREGRRDKEIGGKPRLANRRPFSPFSVRWSAVDRCQRIVSLRKRKRESLNARARKNRSPHIRLRTPRDGRYRCREQRERIKREGGREGHRRRRDAGRERDGQRERRRRGECLAGWVALARARVCEGVARSIGWLWLPPVQRKAGARNRVR